MWVKSFSLEHVPDAVLLHHWDGPRNSQTWRHEGCNHCLQPSQNLFVPLNNKLSSLTAIVFTAWALPSASFSNWDQALWASWGFFRFVFGHDFLIFFSFYKHDLNFCKVSTCPQHDYHSSEGQSPALCHRLPGCSQEPLHIPPCWSAFMVLLMWGCLSWLSSYSLVHLSAKVLFLRLWKPTVVLSLLRR